MTQGTDLMQTQESVQTPSIKFNNYQTAAPPKKPDIRIEEQPQTAYAYHKISMPISALRREASNNELHNSSMLNKSNELDPEDFVMSNTSMSLHTQSQVLGLDTDRGHNVLKDSGITLQEDSTFIADDSKGLMNKQNHEILNRQLTSALPDTPLLPRGREPQEMRLSSQH